MKALPLLVGGLIVFAFMQKSSANSTKPKPKEVDPKPSENPNESESDNKPKNYPTVGSQNIGYEIINCKEIKIYDAKKSLDFAFDTGKKLPKDYSYNTADLNNKLFGKCLNNMKSLTKENALFIFDLMKYGYSGLYFTVGGSESIVTGPLEKFKKSISGGSEFVVEIITENT